MSHPRLADDTLGTDRCAHTHIVYHYGLVCEPDRIVWVGLLADIHGNFNLHILEIRWHLISNGIP
jgi:hypothetical protein